MKQLSQTSATTKQNLMQAFLTLYREKRIDQIRIHEITSLAGYARATFYQYFTDIYDMLEAVEQDLLDYVQSYATQNLIDPSIETIMQNFTSLYIERGEELSTLLGQQGASQFADKLKAALAPVWRCALRLPDTQEAGYIVEFVISAILSSIVLWYKQDCSLPPQRFVELLYPLVNEGIHPVVQAMQLTP